MPMKFDSAFFTESGPRSNNEDAIKTKPFGFGKLAVAIADGLGGHSGGQIASQIAVDTFIERAVDHPADLRKVAEDIHTKICAEQQQNPSRRTMATTLSAAIFNPGLMEFVHCGDSRIVVARGGGIRRLTTDHSEAERLFASGAITKNEKVTYPRKNILESALGIQGTPKIDTGNFPLNLGDKIFFSTDGFHNKVLIRELQKFSLKWIAPVDAVSQMNKEMKVRDPDDNYTFACIFVTV